MGKKIIVAGGGHGGIVCSSYLSRAGFDVTVYEKNTRENMGYDWTDIFNSKALDTAGIALPDGLTKEMHNMSFTPPCGEPVLRQENDDSRGSDVKMERKDIYNILIDDAEKAGVKFVYGCNIEAPLLAGDRVIGIKTSDGDFTADLVIDACGMDSPLRKQLPACCGIQAEPDKYEVFYAYRAFYDRASEEEAKDKYKVYMIPNGKMGIAWVADDGDMSDLLIGEFEPFTAGEAEEKAEFFRSENPILGREIKRGGVMTKIPVRQTLSVMVADGYAAIGDSAFMTVPLIGSGIANSIRAAVILADVVKNDKTETYSAETLWDYQLRYYREIGAGLAPLALIKLLLAKITPEQLDYMFKSKMLTIDDMQISDEPGGGILTLNADLLKKGAAMIKDKKLTLLFAGVAAKMGALSAVTKAIPKHYSRFGVQTWAKRYDRIFKS